MPSTPSELKTATQIRRKDIVAESKRTEGKDQVANYIEDEIVAEGRWPVAMTEIAEECGYTRQHVANTLRDYFEPVGGPRMTPRDMGPTEPETMEIEVPVRAEKQSYMWGYLQGWLDATTE